MRRSLAIAALVFSGAIQAAIAPPWSWIALHPVSWVPALAVIARLRGRRAFLAGWLVGTAANAAIFAWIVHTVDAFTTLGPLGGAGALALFASAAGLYAGLFALGFAPIRRAAGPAWPLAIAAWFTACEFATPQFFPYFQGVAWYGTPRIFLATATTGVAGITFLVLLANAVVLQAIETALARRGGRALAANAVALAALVAIATALAARQEGRVAEAERSARTLRVALVQPGGDPEAAPARTVEEARAEADALAAQAREALAADPSIGVVVFPEKALEWEPTREWNRAVREIAPTRGIEVWTGASAADGKERVPRRYFNSAFRLRADGAIDPRYDKNVLVPFGEYVPFASWLGWLTKAIGRTPFTAGDGVPLFDADPARFAFLICYEAILPAFVRAPVRDGANLIVNLTYDGWFGDTAEPAQHLMLVAVQAAQLGVPILRSTTTGISAFIDARGRIGPRAELFERRVLVADVAPLRAPGVYAAWGDWFAWTCTVASVLLLAVAFARRRAPDVPPRL
jgi:apolipoprotein N-acyltransferase